MATQINSNSGFENFMLIINNLLNKYAPFKKQTKRTRKIKGILRSVKQRYRIYNEVIKAKNSQTKQLTKIQSLHEVS